MACRSNAATPASAAMGLKSLIELAKSQILVELKPSNSCRRYWLRSASVCLTLQHSRDVAQAKVPKRLGGTDYGLSSSLKYFDGGTP